MDSTPRYLTYITYIGEKKTSRYSSLESHRVPREGARGCIRTAAGGCLYACSKRTGGNNLYLQVAITAYVEPRLCPAAGLALESMHVVGA